VKSKVEREGKTLRCCESRCRERFERPQDCIERLEMVKVRVSVGKESKRLRMKVSVRGFSDKSRTDRW
jgi:hypothetical protein